MGKYDHGAAAAAVGSAQNLRPLGHAQPTCRWLGLGIPGNRDAREVHRLASPIVNSGQATIFSSVPTPGRVAVVPSTVFGELTADWISCSASCP